MNNSHKLPRQCLLKIQAFYSSLKTAEKKAADYLLEYTEVIVPNTITELSKISMCSETTWFRLAKRLGYSGFQEMREEISAHLENMPSNPEPPMELYENISSKDSPADVAVKIFETSINAIRDTAELIDSEQYERAVNALLNAKQIMLCGVGDAYSVVSAAYQRFYRAGLSVYMHSDQDLQLISTSRLRKGDVLIAISYSGRTKSVLELVKYAREKDVTIITITNFPSSPIAKNSDIILQTAAFTKYVDGEIVSKRITQFCIIESLYVNLLLKSPLKLNHNVQSSNEGIKINKLLPLS